MGSPILGGHEPAAPGSHLFGGDLTSQGKEISIQQWNRLASAKDYGEAKRLLDQLPEGWCPPAGVTATTRPMSGSEEEWLNLIGSSNPSDVMEAIQSMGQAQGLSAEEIQRQLEAVRKAQGR